MRSATRAGWLNGGGVCTMPWPSRMFFVRCDAAARNTSGALEWLYSSRKWCSTSQHVLDAERVGELDLLERVLEQRVLGVLVPGPGQLVLVERRRTSCDPQ